LLASLLFSALLSLMQQLYMIPEFRYGLLAQLSTDALTDEVARTDSLMYQMQSIFANLQQSDSSYYDAAGFCAAYKDYDGAPMAHSVQMDVNEFFNVLFESQFNQHTLRMFLRSWRSMLAQLSRCFLVIVCHVELESSLKGSPHANLLDHVFGGKLSNQLLGREESCTHRRTREENFYILSLDVKGKKNVAESLKAFVAGEMLEGDNKFQVSLGATGSSFHSSHSFPLSSAILTRSALLCCLSCQCSECNRKVDTLKRVCIEQAPNNLILHLKRFEFDLDSMVKVREAQH
jgi:hypothetical protein